MASWPKIGRFWLEFWTKDRDTMCTNRGSKNDDSDWNGMISIYFHFCDFSIFIHFIYFYHFFCVFWKLTKWQETFTRTGYSGYRHRWRWSLWRRWRWIHFKTRSVTVQTRFLGLLWRIFMETEFLEITQKMAKTMVCTDEWRVRIFADDKWWDARWG